jgi:glycosyltransferase involved in cell wall biosynthesis
MIKVANIVEEGRYGGPQARILTVAECLKDYDIETTVILPQQDSEFTIKILNEKKINFITIALRHLTRETTKLIRYFIFFTLEIMTLTNTLKKSDFDIVHCNGSWQLKGVLSGKLCRKKVILHLNDTSRPKLVKFIAMILGRIFVDGFICSGYKVKKYYDKEINFSKKPVVIIQAPVDTEIFRPTFYSKNLSKNNRRELKIVTVANINPSKGIEYFIKMAYLLNQQFKNLLFQVIGNFYCNNRYKNLICSMIKKFELKNIAFIKGISDVRPYLDQAIIYVCSSIHEASPIAVWEAMAMEKPVVSSNVGDVSKFISNGENGFIVPPENYTALAEKVTILINDKGLREEFGRKTRLTATKYFDVDICVQKHNEFYRKIIDRN